MVEYYSAVKRNGLLIHTSIDEIRTLCLGEEASLGRLPAASFPLCDILTEATLPRQEARCVAARDGGEHQAIAGHGGVWD